MNETQSTSPAEMKYPVGTLLSICSNCTYQWLIVDSNGTVQTDYSNLNGTTFVIEQPNEHANTNNIALLDISTGLYLTAPMYDHKAREAITKAIYDTTPILMDLIPSILEYCDISVEPHYRDVSIYAQSGPPNEMNLFQIVSHNQKKWSIVGIRAVLGGYLRSPTWSNEISQSRGCRGDEFFTIDKVDARDKLLQADLRSDDASVRWIVAEKRDVLWTLCVSNEAVEAVPQVFPGYRVYGGSNPYREEVKISCKEGGSLYNELKRWEARSAFILLLAVKRTQSKKVAGRLSDVLREVFEEFAKSGIVVTSA